LDFAVNTDAVAAGGYYGKGTFYWSGAAGTWFWIDPTDDLIVVGNDSADRRYRRGRSAAFLTCAGCRTPGSIKPS